MRILQVVDFYKPFWSAGGITRSCYEISRRLADMGQRVTIYSNGDGRDSLSKVRKNCPVIIDGLTVYYFRNLCSYLAKSNFYSPYLLPITARRELRNFDIIHIHTFRSTLIIPIWYYAKKYNIPYLVQAHGSVVTFFQKGRLKRVFDAIWGQRILKDASKLIALTPAEAEQYKSMGISEDKIEIMANGIDVSAFENLPKNGEFRVKYGLKDNQKIILYLGRIYKIKGLDLLANAVANISKDISEAKLVIVGPDDGYLPALERVIKQLEIEERVLFTGPLYGRDKLEAYIDADVYVLPSVYETFPMTVLEACACGTPVVVTDRCGIADIIDGQVGLVVPYDRNQLSDAILRMLNDDKIRQQFGEKGKALVREKFDWSKIVEQLEDVYQDVLTKGSTGKKGN